MYCCTCGHAAMTEGELMSHFIECHAASYGIETCLPVGAASADGESSKS